MCIDMLPWKKPNSFGCCVTGLAYQFKTNTKAVNPISSEAGTEEDLPTKKADPLLSFSGCHWLIKRDRGANGILFKAQQP